MPKDEECEGKGGEGKSADAKGDDDFTDEQLVEKVQEFFYADEDLAKTFEGFVKKRAHIVDLNAIEKDDEYKLEYTEAFNEYKVLFEQHMESFIVGKLNCSLQRFFNALKNKTDEDMNSNEAIFGQILLSVCEFDIFMTMLREEAKSSSHK